MVSDASELCVHLVAGPLEKGQVRNEALRELRVELSKKHSAGELDGFALYLYVSFRKAILKWYFMTLK